VSGNNSTVKLSHVKMLTAALAFLAPVAFYVVSIGADTRSNTEWIEARKKDLNAERERETQWRIDVTDRLARIEVAVGAAPQRNDRRAVQTAGTK